MNEAKIQREEIEKAMGQIGKELFTLDAYSKNNDMVVHHERFKKMMQALYTALAALKFVAHIQNHFEKEHPDWEAVCKICGQDIDEINTKEKL
jgi:hypothetical protein